MGNEPSTTARNGRTSSEVLSSPDDESEAASLRFPFLDKTTGITYDTNHSDIEGTLMKKSAWVKEWRERYFILKGGLLFFTKGKFIQPHGLIDLTTCSNIKIKDDDHNYEFEIVGSEDKFSLRAESGSLQENWTNAIRRAISNCLSKQEFQAKYKAMLFRGQTFEKYHNDAMGRFKLINKDAKRLVKVSNDGQRIIWLKPNELETICDSIDMNSVIAINPGHTTLVFKQTGNKSTEANCFSIIAKSRSLDLEADNRDTARQWIEGLRAMLKYGNILTPTELREADHIRNMKETGEERKKKSALHKHENDRAKLRAARERAHQANR